MAAKSKLLVKEDILAFIIQVCGNPKAILCVYCTDEPPKDECINNNLANIDIDNIRMFMRDDIESIFLPKGYKSADWNKVLVCARGEGTGIIGWIKGDTPENLIPADWFDDVKVDF
jgi:hypothetical protein